MKELRVYAQYARPFLLCLIFFDLCQDLRAAKVLGRTFMVTTMLLSLIANLRLGGAVESVVVRRWGVAERGEKDSQGSKRQPQLDPGLGAPAVPGSVHRLHGDEVRWRHEEGVSDDAGSWERLGGGLGGVEHDGRGPVPARLGAGAGPRRRRSGDLQHRPGVPVHLGGMD